MYLVCFSIHLSWTMTILFYVSTTWVCLPECYCTIHLISFLNVFPPTLDFAHLPMLIYVDVVHSFYLLLSISSYLCYFFLLTLSLILAKTLRDRYYFLHFWDEGLLLRKVSILPRPYSWRNNKSNLYLSDASAPVFYKMDLIPYCKIYEIMSEKIYHHFDSFYMSKILLLRLVDICI